jgi:hypothetical protein
LQRQYHSTAAPRSLIKAYHLREGQWAR